eukprot:SAG22_NODE_198_length_15480_cov_24.005526_7_plen_252_part_00
MEVVTSQVSSTDAAASRLLTTLHAGVLELELAVTKAAESRSRASGPESHEDGGGGGGGGAPSSSGHRHQSGGHGGGVLSVGDRTEQEWRQLCRRYRRERDVAATKLQTSQREADRLRVVASEREAAHRAEADAAAGRLAATEARVAEAQAVAVATVNAVVGQIGGLQQQKVTPANNEGGSGCGGPSGQGETTGGPDWVRVSELRAVEAENEQLRRKYAAQAAKLEQAESQLGVLMANTRAWMVQHQTGAPS